MKSIVGVFKSFTAAQNAAESLREAGISPRHITVLAPGSPESDWNAVPTTGTEQPGMGKTVGGMVGGAMGVATGVPLGAALASLLLPGVGPVVAIGIAGAAILGAGGAAAGAAVGRSLENHLFTGLPEDEVFFYEDALRRGHSVVIAFAEDDVQQQAARRLLIEAATESLDAAREDWWLGLRNAEQEHYESHGGNFHPDERAYRQGFEAAVCPRQRGKPYAEVEEELARQYPDASETSFRRGYERGQAHFETLAKPQASR